MGCLPIGAISITEISPFVEHNLYGLYQGGFTLDLGWGKKWKHLCLRAAAGPELRCRWVRSQSSLGGFLHSLPWNVCICFSAGGGGGMWHSFCLCFWQTWMPSAEFGTWDNPVCACTFHPAYTGMGFCKESEVFLPILFSSTSVLTMNPESLLSKHSWGRRGDDSDRSQACLSGQEEAAEKEIMQAGKKCPGEPGAAHFLLEF